MSICCYKEMAINGKLYVYLYTERRETNYGQSIQNRILPNTVESMYLFISYNQKEF